VTEKETSVKNRTKESVAILFVDGEGGAKKTKTVEE
jgi:hypothetical protein